MSPVKLRSDYYVYVWRYPTRWPFYVGMGRLDRSHHMRRSKKVMEVVRSIEKTGGLVIVDRVVEGLTLEQAISKEKELIAKLGRRNVGTGILVNTNPGGEGYFRPEESEEDDETRQLELALPGGRAEEFQSLRVRSFKRRSTRRRRTKNT